MENEPELIRDQMQDTRTALTEKLEALEQHVASTVQSTTSTVTETVQSLTDAVQETVGTVKDTVETTVQTVSGTVDATVDTVKQTFDISGHIERHPWPAMIGGVAVGFVLGKLLSPSTALRHAGNSLQQQLPSLMNMAAPAAAAAASTMFGKGREQSSTSESPRGHNGTHAEDRDKKEDENQGLLGGLMNAYGGEVEKLKGMGVAAVLGVVRDLVTQSVPGELGSRLKEWVNGLTEKMGAQPFKEPIIGKGDGEGADEQKSSEPEKEPRQSTRARADKSSKSSSPSGTFSVGQRDIGPPPR